MARQIPGGGPQAFGILVASVGTGAIAGALVLPRLREKLFRDVLVLPRQIEDVSSGPEAVQTALIRGRRNFSDSPA